MRHVLAMLLALAIGFTTAVPAALADGSNADRACYKDGVASSCVQPAQLTLYPESSSATTAGPGQNVPYNGPYFQQRLDNREH